MTKFNETVVSTQNWKTLKLDKNTKYAPVFIESPDVISEDDFVTMTVRCESVFNPYGLTGNCEWYNNYCRSLMGTPKTPYLWTYDRIIPEDIKVKIYEKSDKEKEDYIKRYNINPYSDIFRSSLVAGPYWRPFSFVDPKTRKINHYRVTGIKWTEMEDITNEIEWFAKTYPQYKVFLTLCGFKWGDEEKDETPSPFPLFTLMLYGGEVKIVTTRTLKQMKKCLDGVEAEYGYSSLKTKIKDSLSYLKRELKWIFNNVAKRISYRMAERIYAKRESEIMDCKEERYFKDYEVRYLVDSFFYILDEEEKAKKAENGEKEENMT